MSDPPEWALLIAQKQVEHKEEWEIILLVAGLIAGLNDREQKLEKLGYGPDRWKKIGGGK